MSETESKDAKTSEGTITRLPMAQDSSPDNTSFTPKMGEINRIEIKVKPPPEVDK